MSIPVLVRLLAQVDGTAAVLPGFHLPLIQLTDGLAPPVRDFSYSEACGPIALLTMSVTLTADHQTIDKLEISDSKLPVKDGSIKIIMTEHLGVTADGYQAHDVRVEGAPNHKIEVMCVYAALRYIYAQGIKGFSTVAHAMIGSAFPFAIGADWVGYLAMSKYQDGDHSPELEMIVRATPNMSFKCSGQALFVYRDSGELFWTTVNRLAKWMRNGDEDNFTPIANISSRLVGTGLNPDGSYLVRNGNNDIIVITDGRLCLPVRLSRKGQDAPYATEYAPTFESRMFLSSTLDGTPNPEEVIVADGAPDTRGGVVIDRRLLRDLPPNNVRHAFE